MSRGRPPLGVVPAEVPRGFPGRVDFIKSAAKLAQAPHLPQPEVCVAGRSNVGKSSLLNVLCNRRNMARTSSTPGRTRLINFFDVQGVLTLVDLPGYGFAKVPDAKQAEWGQSIQRYLAARPQLRLALLLVDLRRDPEQEERDLMAWFAAQGLPCLLVATKADKVNASRRHARMRALAGSLDLPASDVVAFSALDRTGREALWGSILACVGDSTPAGGAADAGGGSDES